MGGAVSKRKSRNKMRPAAVAAARDWSGLPEDLLLIAMAAMEVADVVRLGAVCSLWRSAYVTFVSHRLPTPKQPPCLLYACHAYGPGAAALYSPSTGATFRVPFPSPSLPLRGIAGSAQGWLFTTDEDANPYLLNPLTGARAALPPITTLQRVKSRRSVDGDVVYGVDCAWGNDPDIKLVTAKRARDWMYRRVAVSGSPSAGGCVVVLLVHMPFAELSFARPGDARWTSLSDHKELKRGYYHSAVYNYKNGLFHLLRICGSVHSLDLAGQSSPVAWPVTYTSVSYASDPTKYLAVTPSGDLLIVTRRWRRATVPNPLDASDDRGRAGDEVCTTAVEVDKVVNAGQWGTRMARQTGLGDHALLLGQSGAVCLPTNDFPMLRANCAYLTDDVDGDLLPMPVKRRDLGIWDFERGSMQKLSDAWPLHPWLDFPAPIWITPSLY